MRRVIPYTILPLSLIACALASAPWLRAYPSAVIGVPLFGAALLSVLVPLIVVGIGVRRLQVTALIDVVLFVFYELLVTLRQPTGFADLWTGLVHGPAEILTFALPLVSPRSLLVAPVALCWLAGAIVGECVARGWQSVVPYAVLLATFGLSYAGTARAISNAGDGRRYDTLLAGALLLAILLMRAAQAWIEQDRSAEATQLDGLLPLRGLLIGAVVSIVIALAAAGAVQSSAFTGRPVTPARVPPLNQTQPLTPVSFISGLRPRDPKAAGKTLFSVTFNRATSPYISIASVDTYDGSGWSFDRTFRPSGGVVPPETDPTLRPSTKPILQRYTIDPGAMTSVPWMPYLHRPERVSGTAINIDANSGMIVPATRLSAGRTYSVTSETSQTLFSDLPNSATPSLSGDDTDVQLPGAVTSQLMTLVKTLEAETKVSSDDPVAFLQAVTSEFRTKDSLSGGPATASPGSSAATSASASSATRSAKTRSSHSPAARKPSPKKASSSRKPHRFGAPVLAPSRTKPKPTPSRRTTSAKSARVTPTSTPTPVRTPTTSTSPTNSVEAGGDGFADVLASIRQNRSATPEQYATLTALIARTLQVRARLVTGFRVTPPAGSATLPQGTYQVGTTEAWTWVEIPITGVGWVILDPSPGTYSGRDNESAGPQPTGSPSPTPTSSVQLSKPNTTGGNALASASPVPGSQHTSPLSVVAIIVTALVALMVALLLFLLLRKRVRARRRREGGDPRKRLIGAWQETLDLLVESGMPELDSYTSAEVCVATTEQFGGETGAQAQHLGDAANAAIFGPASRISQPQADAAWQAHRTLRRSVRRRLTWRTRVGASLRYHRSGRERPVVGPASWAAVAQVKRDELLSRSQREHHSDAGQRPRRGRRAR